MSFSRPETNYVHFLTRQILILLLLVLFHVRIYVQGIWRHN